MNEWFIRFWIKTVKVGKFDIPLPVLVVVGSITLFGIVLVATRGY